MGSNPSDKYLNPAHLQWAWVNTKIPKPLNKSILDASGKNGITYEKIASHSIPLITFEIYDETFGSEF